MSDGRVGPLRSSSDRRNYEGNAPQEGRNSETEAGHGNKQPHSCCVTRAAFPQQCLAAGHICLGEKDAIEGATRRRRGVTGQGLKDNEGAPNFWQPDTVLASSRTQMGGLLG